MMPTVRADGATDYVSSREGKRRLTSRWGNGISMPAALSAAFTATATWLWTAAHSSKRAVQARTSKLSALSPKPWGDSGVGDLPRAKATAALAKKKADASAMRSSFTEFLRTIGRCGLGFRNRSISHRAGPALGSRTLGRTKRRPALSIRRGPGRRRAAGLRRPGGWPGRRWCQLFDPRRRLF